MATFKAGFELFFSRQDVPESDCNGKDLDSDGLCLCNGTSWGGDCSHHLFCLGHTRVEIREGTHVLQSSVYATKEALSSPGEYRFAIGQDKHPYPNDLSCTYELNFDKTVDFARIELYYDIEETFDLLRLQSGIDKDGTYNVLSGHHQSSPEIVYVPVDKNGTASLHFSTDDLGRRRGFYAEVKGESSTGPLVPCKVGEFGRLCESSHCLQKNVWENLPRLDAGAVRITSQDSGSFVRAMPWAPDGGCEWEIEQPSSDSSGIRLNFTTFDLEPYPASAVGDKLIIESFGGSQRHELFNESCVHDDTCNQVWQTGKCSEG